MGFDNHVEELLENSEDVLERCALENGALVAADTDSPGYPKAAVNYRFVWPRDASYNLYARAALGHPPDTSRNFARWLLARAEDFSGSGTLIKRYATNGRHDLRYGHEYQPDQAGALIWALHETVEEPDRDVDRAIGLMATGLSRQWRGAHFVHPDCHSPTQDLWEDQEIAYGEFETFTYSLLAAHSGLQYATERLGDKPGVDVESWLEAISSMDGAISQARQTGSYGWKVRDSDERPVDASLSAAVWPFAAQDATTGSEVEAKTVENIGNTLYIPGRGIKRYIGDRYDGIHSDDRPDELGAGTWPLLSFWYAIALAETGSTEKAAEVYEETVENIDGRYIPEQLFNDERAGQGPVPLGWSHAMFVIASRRLGYSV